MSEIWLPDMTSPSSMIRISNGRVYDLAESIAASKYPMQVKPNPKDQELTRTAVHLAHAAPGSGHDNWLMGVRIAFDLSLTLKALVEWERYHFSDIVSCDSTMHRITRFDLDTAYCRYVDPRMIEVMKELVDDYNADPDTDKDPEKYLKVLYNNPAGFIYTMRITTNYRQLKTMYFQRRDHRLPEWREFCGWIETLPEADLIIGGEHP